MTANICTCIQDAAWPATAGVCSFIYDFQTLIAGLAAIGAAWYAGSPVWKQLKDSNLQTNMMHREALAARMREAQKRFARVAEEIDGPLWDASELTSDPEGDTIEIGAEAAFNIEQTLRGRLDWYFTKLKDTEDTRIEVAKIALKTALDDLIETLNDVHWPAHNDQTGEDYAISDADWAALLARSEAAKLLASEKTSAARSANQALKDAQSQMLSELRLQIASLDKSITKSS